MDLKMTIIYYVIVDLKSRRLTVKATCLIYDTLLRQNGSHMAHTAAADFVSVISTTVE